MRFVVYRSMWRLTRQWRWKLLASNNRSIAVSGESYHNLQDCLAMVRLIKGESATAIIVGRGK